MAQHSSTRSVQNMLFQKRSEPMGILVSVHYTGFIKFVLPHTVAINTRAVV